MLHRLPPALPVRGKFRALYEWLNRMREALQACQMQLGHNVRRTQTHQGVLIEGNFGGGDFDFPPGIELREYSICRTKTINGVPTKVERWVRVYSTVVYNKDAQGNPIDDETGALLDPTSDPPLPDTTDEEDEG